MGTRSDDGPAVDIWKSQPITYLWKSPNQDSGICQVRMFHQFLQIVINQSNSYKTGEVLLLPDIISVYV